ncbi:MAG: putative Replicative helicase [Candidatus Sulfotelmatobacter sp.]|nr:putative Replicative helicase [Candidatus Sulfotelmatobacter sp.]
MTTTPILDIDLSRGLPASVEVERSILGAILLDNSAYSEAAEHLRVEDFSLDAHRRIYGRMVELAQSSRPIDLVLLVEELERHKDLEAIGGAEYVAGLLDGVPDRPSIAHYVRIVKEKGQLRGLIFAAQVAIAQALDGETPSEIAGGLLQTVLDVEAQAQMNHALTGRDFMPEVLRELELQAQAGGLVGSPTGLDPLDTVTGGLRKGELIVIGALPGAGKTALACQIVAANAEAGNAVGVFSLEMSRWDLGKRFLSAVTAVSASKIRHPSHIKKDEWSELATGAAVIAEWPVWFDDSGTISVPELLARARLFITRMKAKLIVVDYLQLVRADARDIRERVGKVADALRQLAKAERIPVVLLSQLRRPQNVNDAPTIIDLKESGDIEAHAHVVLLLHVPIAEDGKTKGEDTIIVAKNRNGAKGPVTVTFSPHKLRFYPRTAERDV